LHSSIYGDSLAHGQKPLIGGTISDWARLPHGWLDKLSMVPYARQLLGSNPLLEINQKVDNRDFKKVMEYLMGNVGPSK